MITGSHVKDWFRFLRTRKTFPRLHAQATYPRIERGCQFSHTQNISVGRHVALKRDASLLADPVGTIEMHDHSTVCRFSILQPVGGFIRIGERTCIGDFCLLFGQGGLTIGNDVIIASCVQIVANQHTIEDPDQLLALQPCRAVGITIEDNVWIGTNVVILDGVTIGTGAVIGAGSIVTRSVPPGAIVAGVPARVLRYRNGYGPLEAAS